MDSREAAQIADCIRNLVRAEIDYSHASREEGPDGYRVSARMEYMASEEAAKALAERIEAIFGDGGTAN